MPLVLLLRNHATPSAKALILSARAPCDRRREPAREGFILVLARDIVGQGGLSAVITCLRADWVVAACGSQGLRHCREVTAYDLPITTLFDKH